MVGFRVNGVKTFARDRRGNVAMMWGLLGAVLVGLLGITVDFTRAQMIQAQLQNAADGAALVAARGIDQTDAEREASARAFFEAEVGDLADEATLTFTRGADGRYIANASTVMPVTLARLVSTDDWTIEVESEAIQSGLDLEISLVVDITGSMAGTRIADLRTAANDLVDIVVRDEQTPFYSKLALVPYSMGVNLQGNAANARGSVTPVRSISGASWSIGSAKTITGATRANPVVITSNGHGFTNGQIVWIRNVNGMTQINNRAFVVAGATANTFQLQGVNGTGYSNYTSGGTVQRCQVANCNVVVTANGHGLANNDYVYITGVNGMTQINNGSNATWRVDNVSTNTFSLQSSTGPSYSTYSSGGSAYCVVAGCEFFRFTNPSNQVRVHRITTCVSERVGSDRYTDVAPSTTPVGRVYTSGGTGCPANGIVPLTSDRTALHNAINALGASGMTAGQIGTEWGWYTLSPNFSALWPAASDPASYNAPHLMKIAIIMTDGQFNTAYCNGVTSQNFNGGSNAINCDATNGNPTDQAIAVCDEMKDEGILVYTVGFDVGSNADASRFIAECASASDKAFMATDGAALRQAFREIALSISQLRLSR
jgi:Flp pilus assembly protein TadG